MYAEFGPAQIAVSQHFHGGCNVPYQDELFSDVMDVTKGEMILLWPGKEALCIPDFMTQINEKKAATNSYGKSVVNIRAILLDGTYNQARNMYKSLKKRWGISLPTTVALRPRDASVFHRANKKYGNAHLQQRIENCDSVLRVSTAEACGVLLNELGVGDDASLEMIRVAVKVNNNALELRGRM